jgi:hypothetical protein
MTQPSQNLGLVAQGQKIAGALVDAMAMALSKVGGSTPFGQDLASAIKLLGKHVPAGAPPSDALKGMAMKQSQMAPHQAAMGAAGGGAPPGGMPPGGAAPKPPMPPPGA